MLSFLQYRQTLEEQALKFNGQVKPKFGQVVFLGGSAGCFTGDTLVKTEKGYKPISDVTEGELVYTLNESTHEPELKPVVKVFSFEAEDLIELTTESGETLTCTPDHEIMVDGQWVKAKDTSNFKKTFKSQSTKVYDLSIEGNHNYLVTKDDIVVHNSGKGFAIDKMIMLDAKKYDVDEIKKKIVSNPKFQEFVKKYHQDILDDLNIDVTKLDLKNPEDVSKLHALVASSGLDKRPRRELQRLLSTIDDKSRFPNLIFDVTFKNKAKTLGQAKELVEAGYDPKNIHIVWAVNSVENALANNRKRERSVSDEIVKASARDVATTMRSIFDDAELQSVFDGDWYIVFSNQTGVLTKSPKGRQIAQDYIQVKKSGQKANFGSIEAEVLERIRELVPEGTFD